MTAKEFVTRLFDRWEHGDGQSFFNALAEDVRWTAIGNTPISGTCTSRTEYLDKVYGLLFDRFTGPVRCQVRKIIMPSPVNRSSVPPCSRISLPISA